MFYFCGKEIYSRWWWKKLIDVCQRWRHIIFASPRFLDLRLFCTDKTPTRTSLDIWPQFPIIIYSDRSELDDEGQDNIIAALEQYDRVIEIYLTYPPETLYAVIQKPFPVLKNLTLFSADKTAPVLHEGFLGGSAPHLQSFYLTNITFLEFHNLALSCSYLSQLFLSDIPIAGYISPEAMATCLATLPSLENLEIGFQSPRSRPNRIGRPPPTRVILPTLFEFEFKGVSEYLEDLVARIDTPKLVRLGIRFFMDLMFNIPQLHKFIVRTETIRSLNSAEIVFYPWASVIRYETAIELEISCRERDWQASSMAQVCSRPSPLFSHVELLAIREYTPGQARKGNDIDPTLFMELFDPFPAMQHLHIHGELRPLVTQALQELTGESATEVLPSLRRLVFEGPPPSGSIQKDIQGFITARQKSNHPVDVEWRESNVPLPPSVLFS